MASAPQDIAIDDVGLRRDNGSGMQFALGVTIVIIALTLGVATYLILTGQTRFVPTDEVVVGLLAANAALVVAMVSMIAWQLVSILRNRERGIAGARLHVRLITMFGLVASLPAVLVAVFASVTLDRGLDAWFSERTRAIIDNAQTVAEAYLLEHGKVIRADAAAMRSDVNRAHEVFETDINRFVQFFTGQAALRALSAAYVIKGDGELLVRASSKRDDAQYMVPPPEAFEQAEDDRIVLFAPGPDNMVRALTRLPDFDDAYLFVYRAVDPIVVQHLRETQATRAEYDALEGRRFDVQITFALLYVGMTLIFLLAAIWFGIWVANRMVQPIGQLITAARRVSDGDLDTSVEIHNREGDLAALGRTFNDMTRQIRSARDELVDANTQLDSRRRFTEAVLSGVTAGVVGLDRDGRVELANRAATELLEGTYGKLESSDLARAVAEFAPLLNEAFARPARRVDGQVNVILDGQERNLHVRVTSDRADQHDRGYVVTFDDVTELVTAQRSSAWADIARRIAHEIKNPLTPIQLSAERLKRKYGRRIEEDRDVFEQCTDTIIRQVGDIGRMVDEFSSFARMPRATMEANDIFEVVREAVVLQRVAHPELDFTVTVPEERVIALFDRRLISQALTNLVKNASEAIEGVTGRPDSERGAIAVKASVSDDSITIEVIDNGCGLPSEGRQKLVEPYMTTREKGTGLGLAIVRKIMDEHEGTLVLEDAPSVADGGHGALVRMEFPLRRPSGTAAAGDTPELEGAADGV